MRIAILFNLSNDLNFFEIYQKYTQSTTEIQLKIFLVNLN